MRRVRFPRLEGPADHGRENCQLKNADAQASEKDSQSLSPSRGGARYIRVRWLLVLDGIVRRLAPNRRVYLAWPPPLFSTHTHTHLSSTVSALRASTVLR